MTLKVTVLGCGGSLGVPMIGGEWGACDPDEPRNRRSRASIVVEDGSSRLLIDTSPDMREQLLRAGIARVDAVAYTHHHADHTNGIDDLRPLAWRHRKTLDLYADAVTLEALKTRFPYIFSVQEGAAGKLYKPYIEGHVLNGAFSVGDIEVIPFAQDHHTCVSYGFRIGDFAYSTDVANLDEAVFELLAGVRIWIVDATRREPHPSHAHLEKTLSWIERVQPETAYLTHMNHTMDYAALEAETPTNVTPAYDGLIIEVE